MPWRAEAALRVHSDADAGGKRPLPRANGLAKAGGAAAPNGGRQPAERLMRRQLAPLEDPAAPSSRAPPAGGKPPQLKTHPMRGSHPQRGLLPSEASKLSLLNGCVDSVDAPPAPPRC
eukprot:252633-Pyramimonas_sp.AAC.1